MLSHTALLLALAVLYSAGADDTLLSIEKHIKSCLGDHCGNFKTSSDKARIGLLAPPHAGMDVVWGVLRSVHAVNGFVVSKASKKRRSGGTVVESTSTGGEPQLSVGADVDLVWSTHVPPYGYGRNHGWTKIVRLYRDTADHAYSLLQATGSVDAALVEAQTRLLVRWHCRLSHVAAHTKMLSRASPPCEATTLSCVCFPSHTLLTHHPLFTSHSQCSWTTSSGGLSRCWSNCCPSPHQPPAC